MHPGSAGGSTTSAIAEANVNPSKNSSASLPTGLVSGGAEDSQSNFLHTGHTSEHANLRARGAENSSANLSYTDLKSDRAALRVGSQIIDVDADSPHESATSHTSARQGTEYSGPPHQEELDTGHDLLENSSAQFSTHDQSDDVYFNWGLNDITVDETPPIDNHNLPFERQTLGNQPTVTFNTSSRRPSPQKPQSRPNLYLQFLQKLFTA